MPRTQPLVKSKKRGVNATEAAKAARIAKLREYDSRPRTKQVVQEADPNRPLTEKQLTAIHYWANGESLRNALIKAGFAEGSVTSLTMVFKNDPAIIKAYQAEAKKYEAASEMTRKRVMDGLIEAAELAKLMAEPASMVSAWREIGKMCGYYAPEQIKVDLTVKGQVLVKQMNALSDEELIKLIESPAIEGESTRVDDGS